MIRFRLLAFAAAVPALVASAPSASGGERDALIVHEARLRPTELGACVLELYLTPERSFQPSTDSVTVSIGGIEVLDAAETTRAPAGGRGEDAPRWRFRGGSPASGAWAELDVRRGTLTVRAHGLDLSKLGAGSRADVPVAATLGAQSLVGSSSFRETRRGWVLAAPGPATPGAEGALPFRRLDFADGGQVATGVWGVARSRREARRLIRRAGGARRLLPAVDFRRETLVVLRSYTDGCSLASNQVVSASSRGDRIDLLLDVRGSSMICTPSARWLDTVLVAIPRTRSPIEVIPYVVLEPQ